VRALKRRLPDLVSSPTWRSTRIRRTVNDGLVVEGRIDNDLSLRSSAAWRGAGRRRRDLVAPST